MYYVIDENGAPIIAGTFSTPLLAEYAARSFFGDEGWRVVGDDEEEIEPADADAIVNEGHGQEDQ